jgi:hypothetical protein
MLSGLSFISSMSALGGGLISWQQQGNDIGADGLTVLATVNEWKGHRQEEIRTKVAISSSIVARPAGI